MALAIDASTPAIFGQAGSTSVTSNSFSPPAGSLLVVLVGHCGFATLSAFTMTDSLASHLGWSNPVAAAQSNHEYAQIWIASVGAAPGSMTVTANWTGTTSYSDSITVLVLTGAANNQAGAAHNTATSSTAALASCGVTTTAAGSWCFGIVCSDASSTAPTIPGGQTDVFNSLTMFLAGTSGTGHWVQGTSSPTSLSGTPVTINDTAPSQEYGMAVLEILAAGGGITLDASTPIPVFGSGSASTLTTASFTPPLGAMLLVAFTKDSGTAVTMNAPTNTGGAVTWDSAVAVNISSQGQSAIWRGVVTTSASMTVTCNLSVASSWWGVMVAVITGQAASQTGAATTTNSGTSSSPTGTIASLAGSNSLVVAAINNFSNGTLPTIPTGQSDVWSSTTLAWNSTTNAAGWLQYNTGMNLAAGSSETINDTAPSISWSEAMLEIIAAGAGGGPFFTPHRMPLGC